MRDRYCRACGARIEEGASHCNNCGEALNATYQNQQGHQQNAGYQRGQSGHRQRQHPNQGPDTTLGAITHVLALVMGILGPLILYAVADDPFVKANAAKALNWQIMLFVYGFAAVFVFFFAALVPELILLGILAFFGVFIADLAFCILAAIKASNGEVWSYPLTPDLISPPRY